MRQQQQCVGPVYSINTNCESASKEKQNSGHVQYVRIRQAVAGGFVERSSIIDSSVRFFNTEMAFLILILKKWRRPETGEETGEKMSGIYQRHDTARPLDDDDAAADDDDDVDDGESLLPLASDE